MKLLAGVVGTYFTSDESEELDGPLVVMGSEVLPKVDAVTAVEDENGEVILLGFGGAAYDRRITQYESLWNSHHMRNNGVDVDDRAENAGGKYHIRIKFDLSKWHTIPLTFNGSITTVPLRTPTEEELLTLMVNWVLPPMEVVTPQSIRRSRSALRLFHRLSDTGENKTQKWSPLRIKRRYWTWILKSSRCCPMMIE